MTRLQEERVRILRNDGMGYERIATLMGFDLKTIRNFCHRAGLEGRSVIRDQKGKNCLCCGKPLIQTAGTKTRFFCSVRCCSKWWVIRRSVRKVRSDSQIPVICSHCGKEFYDYPSAHRKYCSAMCCTEARQEKHRNG